MNPNDYKMLVRTTILQEILPTQTTETYLRKRSR